MNNNVIYIFGHKNPDTDTICGAIALSYLKNKLGMNTIPCALGTINAETKYALEYFGIDEPKHLNDVKLQIRDINYHKNAFIDKNLSIKDAYDFMNKYSLTGISIVENKNKYYGYVSLKEIVKELVNFNNKLRTSYGNILKILKGKSILKFDKEISGNVIVTDDNSVIKECIRNKEKLIILINDKSLDEKILEEASNNNINVISTSYNTQVVNILLPLSNYIKNIIRKNDVITFSDIDYLYDFLEETKKLKHINYPIVNNKKECFGLLTITDINNVNKKKVMLVDHNDYTQSVDGLDEAEIIEVIDHHNIGDIATKKPINFRISKVGSVNTIIYDLYKENNIDIPSNIAGIMASSIISDTLLLTSPTTTDKDKEALINLSKIAGINYNEFGTKLLKAGMSIDGLTNEQILYKDFKTYKVDNNNLGIGQVLTSDYDLIDKNDMIEFLNYMAEKNNYKVLTLFVTDIFNNTSHCLYNTNAEKIIKNSFDLDKVYEGVELKNTLSRKIQIAPYIIDAMDKD